MLSLSPSNLAVLQFSFFGSITDSLSIATMMNAVLQTAVSVILTEGDEAASSNASECFQISQPSMHI
jgi:hypothetical protein